MKTKDDVDSSANRPHQVAQVSAVHATKVGWRPISHQLRAIWPKWVARGFFSGAVSTKRVATNASVTTPNSATRASAARQSTRRAATAPTKGGIDSPPYS